MFLAWKKRLAFSALRLLPEVKTRKNLFQEIRFLMFQVKEKRFSSLMRIPSGIFRHCKFEKLLTKVSLAYSRQGSLEGVTSLRPGEHSDRTLTSEIKLFQISHYIFFLERFSKTESVQKIINFKSIKSKFNSNAYFLVYFIFSCCNTYWCNFCRISLPLFIVFANSLKSSP